MCGIAGLIAVTADAPPPAVGIVEAMCASIVHRGPDDQGVHAGPRAHIGMRRLAIIDLAGGRQPIVSDDGRVQLVFNGEIYNFRELRRDLQARGCHFRSDSDSEVILHAYRTHGDAAFEMLRGMFAIAIVDLERDRVVLARDRIGKKPLFYAELACGQLAFGSELKTLHQVPGFDPSLDPQALQDYFVFGYVPWPRTIHRAARKLPPSHLLVIERGRIDLRRYAAVVFEPKWAEDEAALEQRLEAELEDAVRARLVADVPFGAFLSGGVDSSVICALMARNLSMPLKTFTIGFEEREFDEMPDARRVARHIGADHHELVVRPDAAALVQDLAWHFDEPFGDSSALPTYLVSRLAAQHVKMVLSGDGGDELFAGYSRYRDWQRLEAIDRASLGLAAPLLRMAAGLPGAARLAGPGRVERLRRIAARLSQPFPDRYLSGVALSTSSDLALLYGGGLESPDLFGSVRAQFLRDDIAQPLERILMGDMRTYLIDDILAKVDRASMAVSLEARAPLLDQRLIDFVARMPLDAKRRGGEGKRLFRRIARRLLPAEVLDKPKQGFAIPLDRWLRHDLGDLLDDTLGSRAFRERGLFDAAGVERLVAQHRAGSHRRGELLWLLLVFELWARRFATVPVVEPYPRRAPRLSQA